VGRSQDELRVLDTVLLAAVRGRVHRLPILGGTLANAGTWTEADYVMLDGFTDKLRNGPIYNILLTTKCNLPGFFGSAIYANGPNHPRSNTMSLDIFQALGVPNTPFVGAIGVTGSTSGIDFGTCQKLHLLRTSVLFNYTTSASGSWAQPTLYIPFSPSYIGLPVYTQAAFAHPTTKTFQLTGAMRSVIPSLPQWSGFQQLRVTSTRKGATIGTVESTYVPIFRIN